MANDEDPRGLAIKRLKERRDFNRHVAVYVVVNAFLWILWAFTGVADAGIPWPVWPTLGWGVFVALNAWNVYGSRPITEEDIQSEMKRTRGVVDVDHDNRHQASR